MRLAREQEGERCAGDGRRGRCGEKGGDRPVPQPRDQAGQRQGRRRRDDESREPGDDPAEPGRARARRRERPHDSEDEQRCRDAGHDEHGIDGAQGAGSHHGRECREDRDGGQWYERRRDVACLYSAVVSDRPRAVMTRAAFLAATDALIARGDRLVERPAWEDFRSWLLDSDRLLERVWGRMDRYHLAWLNVGRGSATPGSTLDEEGTRRFIAEVASGKLAVLRTMRASVERQGSTLLSDDDPDAQSEQEDR
jgi:hypothetical protein